MSDIFEKLAEMFSHFPGIGDRQSKRFVYYLMSKNPDYVSDLVQTISELKKETAQCAECFRFFNKKGSNVKVCEICANASDPSMLMVLEKDSDLESVHKSRTYGGKYFLLGGLVPIVEKNTKNFVRIEELKNKIKNSKSELKEIILAFSLSPQGEHTDFYVRSQLKDIAESLGIKISSLGRGLSTGTELEYSDNDTLKNAFKNRQ